MERKYFIDNLRILCILLLFPFHVGMFYNDFGERFYVHIADCVPASLLNISTYPWWMPLLFVLAGASTFYAFEKRTAKQYIIERVLKLYIPFNAALILVIPVQPYLADIYFNNYSGNYFEHFKEFFVFTDFTGYDGHFTPAQTWFILYLFLISLISLPLLKLAYAKNFDLKPSRFMLLKLLLIGVVLYFIKPIANLGGKSIAEFMAWFLIGFFVFSNETFQEKTASWSIVTFPIFAILLITRCVMYKIQVFGSYWDLLTYIFTWSGILSLFGLGKKFLNFNSAFTKYFSQASYSLYILHQSVIVILGFFAAKYVMIPYILQYILIVLISFAITVGLFEIFRRNKVTSFLLGIKRKKNNLA